MEISRERPLGGQELVNALIAASLVDPDDNEYLVLSIPETDDAVDCCFTDEAGAKLDAARRRALGHNVAVWRTVE